MRRKWSYCSFFGGGAASRICSEQHVAIFYNSHLALFFLSKHFVRIQGVQLYSSTDMITAWSKSRIILLEESNFQMIDNQSIAVHAFPMHMLISISVDENIIHIFHMLHVKICRENYTALFKPLLYENWRFGIYIYIYICFGSISSLIQISLNIIDIFCLHFFLVDPFILPYWSYNIWWELIDISSIIVYFLSTFCPTLGHHQWGGCITK